MQRGAFQVTTAPASEPVSLTEAKAHLRVEFDDDDALITSLISAARDYCERYLHRSLLTQTITQVLPAFPCWEYRNQNRAIRLFRPPLATLKTIKYYDSDNTLQTLYDADALPTPVTDTAIVNTIKEPPEVTPTYGEDWPQTADREKAVELVYTAGWSASGQVPQTIKAAMLLIIGEMYERRENFVKQLPTAAEHLLNMWQVREW